MNASKFQIMPLFILGNQCQEQNENSDDVIELNYFIFYLEYYLKHF